MFTTTEDIISLIENSNDVALRAGVTTLCLRQINFKKLPN